MRRSGSTRGATPRGAAAGLTLAVLLGAAPLVASSPARGAPAPADSARTAPASRDTASIWVAPPPKTPLLAAPAPAYVPTKSAPPAPADTSAPVATPVSTPGAAPGAARRSGPSAIDTTEATVRLEALRKRGDVSLTEVLRGRAGVLVGLFPGFGTPDGSIAVPDAGSRIRPWPATAVADRATDRTVVASVPLFLGAPDLATAWDGPDADGVDAFTLLWLDQGGVPEPFRSAGGLLASPRAESYAAAAMPGEIVGGNHPRSALYYRKGERGALDTGARFSSPLLARGIAAAFTRHASDELPPFLSSLSTRYNVAAGLPRLGPVHAWVEGTIFEKRTEVDIRDGYAGYLALNGIDAIRERAEWASRAMALHGRAGGTGSRLDATGTLRVGDATRTQVDYAGARERWAFPETALEGDASWRAGGPWTATGALDLSSRRVSYRADSVAALSRRIESARVAGGMRRPLGGGWNGGFEGAVDAREGDATLLDARLSLWRAGARGRLRLDVESAHERPSYVDLETPLKTYGFFDPTGPAKPGSYVRAGDPSLRARSLRGALASAELAASRSIRLSASGALRRLGDDFGWNASRIETPDSVLVFDVAGPRGSGWAAFGSLGLDATAGPLRARGLGWIRGSGARSPQAGSPPRRGFEGTADLFVVLFGGDLPLHVDLSAHATGPRAGLIRAPALVSWDAGLRADFGSAGAFFEFDNVLDERVPSAIYEIDTDSGAPLPRRTFHFGIVWYLLD
ncbi:MAG TPA: hypothetical protein VF363_11635 [Candidatus Eisenbacteria bacterium]